MKKSRILSLILAAVLAASSLPVVTSVSAAATTEKTPYNVNLLADDISTNASLWQDGELKPTTGGPTDPNNPNTVLESNTYLRRDAKDYGAQLNRIRIDLPSGTTISKGVYTLYYDARAQIDGTEMDVTSIRSTADWVSNLIYNTWQPRTAKITVNSDGGKVWLIDFRGGPSEACVVPVEFDNIIIKDSSDNTVYENNFDTINSNYNGYKLSWAEYLGTDGQWNNDEDIILDPTTETKYLNVGRVDPAQGKTVADTNYNVAIKHNPNEVLTPGKYEFTFDARQSYYFDNYKHNDKSDTASEHINAPDHNKDEYAYEGVTIPASNASNVSATPPTKFNSRGVAVKLAAGSTSIIDETVTVTDKWGSYKMEFTVPAGQTYTLDSISFGGTGKAYDNDAFDINNISLKLVEPEYTPAVDAIEPGLLAGAEKSAYTVVSANPDFSDTTTVPGDYAVNGYITTGKLPWIFWDDSGDASDSWQPTAWMLNLKLNHNINKNETYGVTFKARTHVPSPDGVNMKVHMPYEWNKASDSFTLKNDEWTDVAYTCGGVDKANTPVSIYIRRDGNNHTAPIDIDDLTVWIDANKNGKCDDGENILYSENFNDPNQNYIDNSGSTKGKLHMMKNADSKSTRLVSDRALMVYHNFDRNYGEVNVDASNTDASVSYTNITGCGAGKYIFSADLAVPYHNGGVISKLNKSSTDDDALAIYKYNDHDVEVEFTITPVGEGTATTEKVVLTDVISSVFSKVEAMVTVDEGCTLTGIKVTPKFDTNAITADANKKLQFKNVDLKFASPLSNIVDADPENFLDNATEDYGDSLYEETAGDNNGYVSFSARQWGYDTTWSPNWQLRYLIWQIDTGIAVDPNCIYYAQFDMRNSVPTNGKQDIRISLLGVTEDFTYTPNDEMKWTDEPYKVDVSGAGKSGNVILFVRKTGNSDNIPLDFDNVVIWKEAAGGDGKLTDSDAGNILYSSDYNDITKTYASETKTARLFYVEYTDVHNADDAAYGTLTPEAPESAPILTYTALNGGAGHGEGVYSFKADLRVPYFHYENFSVPEGKDGAAFVDENNAAWKANNIHEVEVLFTMEPIAGGQAEYTKLEGDLDYNWNTFETSFVVKEGYKLTGIEIKPTINSNVPAGSRKLDFKNVILCHADLPVISDENTDNYLNAVKPTYDNVIPTEVIEASTEGYLYVGERTGEDKFDLFKIHTGAEIKTGTEYVIEFDFTAYENKAAIRPTLNVKTDMREDNGTLYNDNYFGPADGNALSVNLNAPGIQYETETLNTPLKFKGEFEARGTTKDLEIRINKSNQGYSPFAIDNVKVYEKNSGKVIYENDFNAEECMDAVTVSATTVCAVEQILHFSHTLYTPEDATKPMKINYDLGLTPDEAVEGKYSFKTMVKLSEATDKPAKARVIFNFSDGTSDINYIDLTENWSYIGKSDWLDRYPDLVSITIEFDSDVPVMLISPELNIVYKYRYGKPNTGIVMVLIKKMQGEFTDPWKQIGIN